MDWECGGSRCKLLHLEEIDKEVLLYSTGNSIQPGIDHDGEEEFEKNVCIYICITKSLCSPAEISTLL